jgi:putative membrane protein
MQRLGLVLALALVGGGAALADRPAGTKAEETKAMGGGSDKQFADKAATGGLAEVKLSKLAMEKGQSMQVKQFARKMVEDHNKANTELKQIAEKKGMTLPTQLDDKHQKAYERLTRLEGPDFDREYMKAMTDDHDDTVKLFKDQMENGKDPDLKSFAMKTLPTLEKHDDLAHTDQDTLKKTKY